MTLTPEDIELIKAIVLKNPDSTVQELINTAPETPVSEIPNILKSMTATALKKQFGLNTLEYKFIGIKDFMQQHNIVTGNKYAPTLNYEHKHLINEIIIKAMPKKQQVTARNKCIKTLKGKLENPPKQLYGKTPTPKQLEHIQSNIQRELDRW